ncbi:hypothetical protein KJ940_22900 [Myxococcota bacterium]|nr:hypothetical protein [Myxococcota bacterium]
MIRRPPSPHRPRLGLGALALWLLCASPASAWWVRLETDSVLQASRWQGLRPEPIDRTDMRQRLRLQATQPHPRRRQAATRLIADLEVGADLGPGADLVAQQIGEGRAALVIYEARLSLVEVVRRVDIEVGRAVSFNALGLRVIDGLGLETRWVPFTQLKAQIGIAPRRGWSDVGPQIYDGTDAASDRPAYRAQLSAASRGLRRLALDLAFARDFDAHLQAEEIGAAARLDALRFGPRRAQLYARAVYATLIDAPSTLEGELRYDGPHAAARFGARRLQPVFAAESIWNAFGALPYDGLYGGLSGRLGDWRLEADGLTRHFKGDTDKAALVGLPYAPLLGGLGEIAPPQPKQGFDVGGRLTHGGGLDAGGRLCAEVGLEGRAAWGDLGARQLAEARLTQPLTIWGQAAALTGRAGGLRVAAREDEITWWGAGEVSWRGVDHWRIDARLEGALDPRGARLAGMLRLRLEDLW